MLFLTLIVILSRTLCVNYSAIIHMFSFIYVFSFCKYSLYSQNAGAVIGKGGKNIKALRTDVSTSILYTLNFYFCILYFFLHWCSSLSKLPGLICRTAVFTNISPGQLIKNVFWYLAMFSSV